MLERDALLIGVSGEMQGKEISLSRFPFKVGRDVTKDKRPRYKENTPGNYLYLVDADERLNVSKEHFQIDFRDGMFYISDLGSVCGTIVNGIRIGGDRKSGQVLLDREFNDIVVGRTDSPFRFKLILRKSVNVYSGGRLILTAAGQTTPTTEHPPQYRLNKVRCLIGRSEDSDLKLPFKGVSERHAQIFRSGIYTLLDVGSADGGVANGLKGSGYPLDDGQRIKFDDLELELVTRQGQEKLVGKNKSAAGKEFTLDKDIITVGRDRTCDIVIPDDTGSGLRIVVAGRLQKGYWSFKVGNQVQLTREGYKYTLYDLHSSSGTFVNGRRLMERILKSDDLIKMDQIVLEFKGDDL